MEIDMSIFDFDSMESYQSQTKEVNLIEQMESNKNLLILKRDSKVEILEGTLDSSEWGESIFDDLSEEWNDVEYIKFTLSESFENFTIYKNRNYYILRLNGDEIYHLFYIDDLSTFYLHKNTITFQGWDSNILIDLDTMTSTIIHTR